MITDANNTASVVIKNRRVAYPATGGYGSAGCLLAGFVLMMGAVFIFLRRQ